MRAPQPLTYSALDGLAFAAERGRLAEDSARLDLFARDLGPFLEYVVLAKAGLLPSPERVSWLALNGSAALYAALSDRRHYWVCPMTRRAGLYRTYARLRVDDTSWTEFCFAAQHAASAVGFLKAIAAQLVGAMGEMESNIYEHSQASGTGVIAFNAVPGAFEFVVADCGIGVLQSLKSCSEYAELADHGEALRLTLTDGVSRYGAGSERGHGFRPLFTGLANLNGALRFRSGDHALTINGQGTGDLPAKLAKKTNLNGFFASVDCQCS